MKNRLDERLKEWLARQEKSIEGMSGTRRKLLLIVIATFLAIPLKGPALVAVLFWLYRSLRRKKRTGAQPAIPLFCAANELYEQGKPSFRDMKRVGVKGFLFALLGSWLSKKLGKIVGVSPGSDMKAAVTLARQHKCMLALIDQPIDITLRRFSQTLSWKEKVRIVADIVKGVLLRRKDPLLDFDLKKVPPKQIVRKMVGRIKERYPNIHKVLIEERNYYMARKLKRLMRDNPGKSILAVVGAGHEEDILSILKENEGIAVTPN